MKNIQYCLPFLFLTLLCGHELTAQGIAVKISKDARQRLLFDDDWQFQLGDVQGAEETDFKDKSWRTLDLPHDWSIEGEYDENAATGGSGGSLPTGIAWYRKHFSVTANQKNISIEFDGVYMNSEIWINGQSLGKHPNGYISFYHDLTPYLKKGENVIAVKVDNSIQTNSRWYSGSGIYRHVWLNITNPVHVSEWGTFITTPFVDSLSAMVAVKTKVENNLTSTQSAVLNALVIDNTGNVVAETETPIIISAGGQEEINQFINVGNPSLWSDVNPNMYKLKSIIKAGNKVLDQYETPFGIRSIKFDAKTGFSLNGEQVKMNGVCLHHDAGVLGAAVPIQVWERRFKLLKDMGCNAIRTSHNAMAPEFMDLCDEMGFLVMNEPFDEWEEAKGNTTSAYHIFFKDNWKDDLLKFIHRDRNHPSVVIYSAGNEIPDQSTVRGQEVLRQLMEVFHAEDPTRPVTTANDRIAADSGMALIPFLEMLDVVGYNYVDRWHERRELFYSVDKMDHPDWLMIGTENSGVRGTRGNYSLGGSGRFSRSYSESMIRGEMLWKFTAVNDYVAGDFMWTGIDYLGEARWPSRGASSGVIDMAGFEKDSYYFYQSQWTDDPMIHVFPNWNWEGKEGEVIPVLAYSNCEAIELFVNGKSFGEQKLEFPRPGNSGSWNTYDTPPINGTTSDLHVKWTVPYEPGTIKAVGKIGGEVVYTTEIKTAGKPAGLRVKTDKNNMNSNGDDIVHLEVEVVDKDGIMVPDADNAIFFKVTGPAKLIGVENGNQRDLTKPQSLEKQAYLGLILGYLQSTDITGKVDVEVSSPGLKSTKVSINVEK